MGNVALLRAQLEALKATVEASLLVLDGDVLEDQPPCPHCGEGERIEDTSAVDAPLRRTCKSCGLSWQLEVVNA